MTLPRAPTLVRKLLNKIKSFRIRSAVLSEKLLLRRQALIGSRKSFKEILKPKRETMIANWREGKRKLKTQAKGQRRNSSGR
jgi:hypothetical protein